MGARNKVIRPVYDDYDDEDVLDNVLVAKKSHKQPEEDDLSTLSFGALNSAQKKLMKPSKHSKSKQTSHNSSRVAHSEPQSESDDEEDGFSESESGSESDSDSDSDAAPTESSSTSKKTKFNKQDHKRRSKHAPSESSSKKFVSKIRKIPGLDDNPKYSQTNLYGDIRFDATYGKADLLQTRKNYGFLDEYRQQEIQSMQAILKDKKSSHMLSDRQREDIQNQVQSLKSRLDTMKNRDLEHKILTDHKRQQMAKFKDGTQARPFFLKKSEKRKLLQKAKFDTMKASQREKVMERKRKKRLGKEFRQLEFNKPTN